MISFCLLGLVTYAVALDVPAVDEEIQEEEFTYFMAFVFLAMFILMASVNIMLLYQIRARNREVRNTSEIKFKKERWTLSIILLLFELSYLSRFAVNLAFAEITQLDFTYKNMVAVDFAFMLDGLAMFSLLFFHHKNFKLGSFQSKLQENHLRTTMATMA